MRRLNAAVAAVVVCGLTLLPSTVWSQSGLFGGETKIIIHNDEIQPDSEKKPEAASALKKPDAPPAAPAPAKPAAAAPAPSASNAALPNFLVMSPAHRSCVEAASANADSPLVMKPDCRGASQQWISDKGRLMTAWMGASGSRCIGRASAKSDRIELASCRAGDTPAADQMWVMRGAQIVGIDGRCLQSDGQGLRVAACDPQNGTQMWVTQPVP